MYLVQLIEHLILQITNILFIYFLSNFFQIKVLNKYQNTLKNVNITRYIERKKTLCNTLNWGNWNSGFLKLGVWWGERDISLKSYLRWRKVNRDFSVATIFFKSSLKLRRIRSTWGSSGSGRRLAMITWRPLMFLRSSTRSANHPLTTSGGSATGCLAFVL